MNDLEDYLMSDDYQAIMKNELTFADPIKSEYWTSLDYVRVDLLYPEIATKR